jgi:hypothetical protein
MESEGNEDLHGIVLKAAFRNLLANHQQLHLISAEGVRLCFNQHLFLLFSPLLRSLLSSLPPEWKVQGEPLTILLPDTEATVVLRLSELLTTGSTSNTGMKESQDVVQAAAELGISMSSLEGAGGVKVERKTIPSASSNNVNVTDSTKPVENENMVDTIMKNVQSITKTVPEAPVVVKKEPGTDELSTPNEVDKPSENILNKEPSVIDTTAQPPHPPITPNKTPTMEPAEASKEFQCKKCQKAFDNLMHLRSHYCLHFKMILKKKFNNLSPDNKCTECSKQPVFASSDRLLLHIGVHHRKIDEILKSKGINLPVNSQDLPMLKPSKVEVPSSPVKPATVSVAPPSLPVVHTPDPTPAPVTPKPKVHISSTPRTLSSALNILDSSSNSSINKSTVSESNNSSLLDEADSKKPEAPETRVNCDLKCEVCNQEQKSINLLEQHCCRHFMKDLKDQYASLMDGGKCNICGNMFKQQHSLLMHIGCKHGKINEVLKQKGFAALPCPVINSTSAALQRQLMQIKKEKVDTYRDDDDFNLDTGNISVNTAEPKSVPMEETTSTSDKSYRNIKTPSKSSDVPTTLDEILRKYKFTTGTTS